MAPSHGCWSHALLQSGDNGPLVVQPGVGCFHCVGVLGGHTSFHLEAERSGRVLGQGDVKGEGMADPDFQSSWVQED